MERKKKYGAVTEDDLPIFCTVEQEKSRNELSFNEYAANLTKELHISSCKIIKYVVK